jgi:hypothetical protein
MWNKNTRAFKQPFVGSESPSQGCAGPEVNTYLIEPNGVCLEVNPLSRCLNGESFEPAIGTFSSASRFEYLTAWTSRGSVEI